PLRIGLRAREGSEEARDHVLLLVRDPRGVGRGEGERRVEVARPLQEAHEGARLPWIRRAREPKSPFESIFRAPFGHRSCARSHRLTRDYNAPPERAGTIRTPRLCPSDRADRRARRLRLRERKAPERDREGRED